MSQAVVTWSGPGSAFADDGDGTLRGNLTVEGNVSASVISLDGVDVGNLLGQLDQRIVELEEAELLVLPFEEALTFAPDNTHDIGPAGYRPRHVSVGTSLSTPTLELAGQDLGGRLTSLDTRIDTLENAPAPLPLTETLTFAPDSQWDIGESSNHRPRNLFLSGAASIGGPLTLNGLDVGNTLDTLDVRLDVLENAPPPVILPFSEHVTFAPDNVHDIGAIDGQRPRDLWVGRNITAWGELWIGEGLRIGGHVRFGQNNAFDIGGPIAAVRPRDVYVGRTVHVGQDVEVVRDVIVQRELVLPRFRFSGQAGADEPYWQVSSVANGPHLINRGLSWAPDSTWDLGGPSGIGVSRPRDVYVGRDIHVGGTLNVRTLRDPGDFRTIIQQRLDVQGAGFFTEFISAPQITTPWINGTGQSLALGANNRAVFNLLIGAPDQNNEALVMRTALAGSGDPVSFGVDQQTLSLDLRLHGGGVLGRVRLDADPLQPLHAATKQYVDGLIAALDSRIAALEAP